MRAPGEAAQGAKLLELEGLRGIAALFVVLAHLQALFFRQDYDRYLHALDTIGGPLALVLKCLSLAAFLTSGLSLPAVIGLGTVFYLVADKPSVPFSKWIASKIMGRRNFSRRDG